MISLIFDLLCTGIILVQGRETTVQPRNAWKFCGNFATGHRDAAMRLSKQLETCDKGQWGKEFTVEGIENADPPANSSCLGVACDEETSTNIWVSQSSTVE